MPFRDAAAWLRERGVPSEPLGVDTPPDAPPPAAAVAHGPDASQPPDDDVAEALVYVRRATAATPVAEGRLRDRLGARGHPPTVVEEALARARADGTVDDAAFVAALVEEGRRKGHAPRRVRATLEARGFDGPIVERALAEAEPTDLEAAAYAVAADRTRQLRGVAPETAFRRLVGHLARRGYPDMLARKVARQAVFTDREDQRTAER